MAKLDFNKPVLIMLYGYPGAGKSFFARQFSEVATAALVDGDKIRYEVFENPTYNKQENDAVDTIMLFMAGEFLEAGVSVIYDCNAMKQADRRRLRELASKHKANYLLIWLQTDIESSFLRVVKRDRRKADDRYATPYDRTSFEDYIKLMQNPKSEDFVVVSGKHAFNTQKGAVLKKMYEKGFLTPDTIAQQVVKPGLVNLVPALPKGLADRARRNIVIR